MAVAWTGAGSAGVRGGHLFGGMLDAMALAGGAATARVLSGANLASRATSTITPDYANGTALPQVLSSPALMTELASWQSGLRTVSVDMATYFCETIRCMYAIDALGQNANAPLSQLLSVCSLSAAVQGLINQCVVNSTTFQAPDTSSGSLTNVGTPVGNPTVVVSLKNPQGKNWALMFNETLSLIVTKDSVTGALNPGQEQITITGQPAISDPLSYLWPGGSGANKAINAVRGDYAYGGSTNLNILTNSNFSTFTTANAPDNWAFPVGTVGTQILNGSTTGYISSASHSVEFVGDAATSATLTCIVQPFNTTSETGLGLGGTPYILLPDTVYHLCGFLKLSAGSPAGGVFEYSLIDGASGIGNIVADDSSTNNTATTDLTAIADTNWHAFTLAIRTPANPPATTPQYKLRLRLSTALSTGTNLFISNVTMLPAYSLYPGGPWVTFHAGSTNMLAGLSPDTWTMAISNNYSTSGKGLYQQSMERCLNINGYSLQKNGVQFPTVSGGGATVLDSLIA